MEKARSWRGRQGWCKSRYNFLKLRLKYSLYFLGGSALTTDKDSSPLKDKKRKRHRAEDSEHSVCGEKDFCYKESPQQTELINSALQPPPQKMIPPPTAQEHLGMFSANVITASISARLFKGPLLLLSHFNTWWCHGPLWGHRNSSNQLPLMTFSFRGVFSPLYPILSSSFSLCGS